MSRRSALLCRPSGSAPRGTSAGIVGYTLLSTAKPFIVLEGLIPVLANGLDIWLGSILPVIGVAIALQLVLALAASSRSPLCQRSQPGVLASACSLRLAAAAHAPSALLAALDRAGGLGAGRRGPAALGMTPDRLKP